MYYDLAKSFHVYPMGRQMGEDFRERILIPELSKIKAENISEKLIIQIDGCKALGSSFLEEAFGGLVRKGFTRRELRKILEIRAELESKKFFVESVWDYINRA